MKQLFKMVIVNISGYSSIEPVNSYICLGIYISEERNMIITEKFIRSLVTKDENIQFTIRMLEHGMMKHVT